MKLISLMNISRSFFSIVAPIIAPIIGLYRRFGWIPARDREYLYTLLGESLKSNIPMNTILDQIETVDSTPLLQKFALFARSAHHQTGDFTAYLGDEHLLPPDDIELLRVGVSEGALAEICDHLITQEVDTIDFDQHLFKTSKQAVMSIPVGIILMLIGGHMLKGMRKLEASSSMAMFYVDNVHIFFHMHDFVEIWWPTAVFWTLLFLVAHRVALPHLVRFRTVGYAFNFFKLYDEKWELKLTRICALLAGTGMQSAALLDQLGRIADGNRRLYLLIHHAKRSASEKSLLELLPEFLTPRTVAKVKSMAPNQTPEEIASGFVLANKMNYLAFERNVELSVSLVAGLCLLVGATFIAPLVALVVGV